MLAAERLVVLLALAALVAAGWGALRLWRELRIRQLGDVRPFATLVPGGVPAVIAFSTPGCAECRSRQAPALARLAHQKGAAVTIRTLSALEHPEMVARLGILTVPATVVLDATGVVRQINLGFAPEAQLSAQLAQAARSSDRAGVRL
jgi:DhnA family fructose-bisphosphate aldolase class Ia